MRQVCRIEITNVYVNSMSKSTMVIRLHTYAIDYASSMPH